MTMVELDGVFTPIPAPATTAYRYGLFSVAPPSPDAASAWEGTGVTWKSQGCTVPRITFDPCIVDEVDPLIADRFCTFPQWQPFTVYELTESSPRNADDDDRANRDRLAEVEQFAVEARLWVELETAGVSTVAAASMIEALAVVEQTLVESYPARGVIHMNRFTATVLGAAGALIREGAQLQTMLGTPVVAGGGYEAIAGAVPGSITIYGTGPIELRRGTIASNRVNDLPRNRTLLQAYRTYVVGWDCTAVGATADT